MLCVYRKNVALLLENVKSAMGIRMSEFHITSSLVVAAAAAYMLRWAHGNIASNFREIFVSSSMQPQQVRKMS